ncbi:SMEK domain-containing protein [Kordiimonas sp.]|uniref:SMEK domain-containing protein n=1 Tax=Kordiimonas sp. TaxID=1970157 RepID=UPI003A8CEE48
MRQLEIENQLRDIVSRIILQVELATGQGRTDINLALEDAFIPILKSVYNLPNLINLNRKQKNYPGIDLGDDHDRVCFQVTSTTSIDKVKKTVEQFMARKYFNSFDELFILTLLPKQSSYSQSAIDKLLTADFSFNCKKHIIDLKDLLGEISGLRIAAQERVLAEFKRILGDVDAYVSYSANALPAPMAITTNLQEIILPDHVYVAELDIDKKAVAARATDELGYRGKARGDRSFVRMALLLNGMSIDSWVSYEGKLFSFHDIEYCGLSTVVVPGTVERLEVADLVESRVTENVNILKQLLFAETEERLKKHHVSAHPKDRFFFFQPKAEGDAVRMESWIGKQRAQRRVYEVKYQTKDPTKVAYHKHLSFTLTFSEIGDHWYAQIVPSWYYSYNGFKRSRWHEDLLAKQKRLDLNQTVRNAVRFAAYFLSNMEDQASDVQLRFGSLVEFDMEEIGDLDEAEAADEKEEIEGAVA